MKSMFGVIIMVIAITANEVQAQLENSYGHLSAADAASSTSAATVRTLQVEIKGMSCMACVATVKTTLSGIDGIKDVHVKLFPGSAKVVATSKVTTQTVVAAINRLNYEAKPKAPIK